MTIVELIALIGSGAILTIIGWLVKITIVFTEVRRDVEWIKETMDRSGKRAGKVLHSPHTPRLDYLIERFWREELTMEEVREFLSSLVSIQDDNESGEARKIAALKLLEAAELRYRISAAV